MIPLLKEEEEKNNINLITIFMKTDNLKEVTEAIASICQQENIECICICTKKDSSKTGISAFVCGNPLHIIMAIIKGMEVDNKLRAILETAIEHKEIVQTIDQNSRIEKILKKIFPN